MSTVDDDILITGVGLVTSLGLDLPTTWDSVLAGRCGVGAASKLEQCAQPDYGYGQAPTLPDDFMSDSSDTARYLRWVIDQALRDAKMDPAACDPSRLGMMLGTTLHGMRAAGVFFRSDDPKALGDFQAASVLAQAMEGLPIRGWATTTCAACASGLASIALGVTMLHSGRLDVVIAGGYDPVSEYAYAGFNSLRLVAPTAQMPFARDRQGLKLSEGYGVVVLERATDAAARNAPVFVRISGCGASADAHHLSQPHPEGEGAAAAIRQALNESRIGPESVGMIAAHATATPDNDGAECKALRAVLGDHLPNVPVTAFKSHLGHSLGAAGAVELILAAQSLREGVAPHVANVAAGDVEFEGLDVVTGKPRYTDATHAMVISLGFGGSNACTVISTPDARASKNEPGILTSSKVGTSLPSPGLRSTHGARPQAAHKVCITGVGLVLPGMVGRDAFMARMHSETMPTLTGDAGAVDEALVLAQLSARRLRRLSEYVKLLLAATAMAVRDAGLAADGTPMPDRWGAITGTAHGSAGFSEEYYRQIVREGMDAANPLLFAEGVPNAGSAHLSMMLNLRGPCQTLVGSRTAGLDALVLAAERIATGLWDGAIVNAADEYGRLVNHIYGSCGLYNASHPGRAMADESGFAAGAGSVSLVLESLESARSRGVKPLARLGEAAQTLWVPRQGRGTAWEPIAAMLHNIGANSDLVCSAHATWLDKIEMLAIRKALGKSVRLGTMYGHVAECFSAMPLAAIASCIWAGHVPGHDTPCNRFTVLASDYNGLTTAMNLERD